MKKTREINKCHHLPVRTCCACHQKRLKQSLLRIVRLSSDHFMVDVNQVLPGRGAYVCPTIDCVNRLVRDKALNRAFRQEVPTYCYQRILSFLTNSKSSG